MDRGRECGFPQEEPRPLSSGSKLSFGSLYPDGAASGLAELPVSGPWDDVSSEDDPLTLDNIDIKATLTKFYEQYAPDKLERIDFVWSKYKGEEGDLFDDLVSRYNVSEDVMLALLVRKPARPSAKPSKPPKRPDREPAPEPCGGAPPTLGRVLSMRCQAPQLDDNDDDDADGEAARAERASQSRAPPIRQGPLTKVRIKDGQRVAHAFILREDALYYVKKQPMDAPIKFLARLTGWDLGTSTMIERNTRSIDMTKLMVSPVGQDDAEALQGDLGFAFILRSKRKSFYLLAPSISERDAWMAAIEVVRMAAQLKPDGTGVVTEEQTCPLFISKEDIEACTLCSRGFGLLSRRHHCRDCGTVVCDGCSRTTCRIPRLDDRMLFKCCNSCATRLKEARRYGAASVI